LTLIEGDEAAVDGVEAGDGMEAAAEGDADECVDECAEDGVSAGAGDGVAARAEDMVGEATAPSAASGFDPALPEHPATSTAAAPTMPTTPTRPTARMAEC
jgi:hypothetical protein